MFIHAVASVPAATRPVQETKSKSKTAVQSTPEPITKAVFIASFQQTFAYLTRAAVRNQLRLHLGGVVLKIVDNRAWPVAFVVAVKGPESILTCTIRIYFNNKSPCGLWELWFFLLERD